MKIETRNSIRGLLLIPLVLACFALLTSVQASPDPAALSGGNVRDGAGTLDGITTGINNSAFGTNALHTLTTGNNNAAQGNSALFSSVDGNKNVAVGVLALRFNITGDDNTAVGYRALNNSTGSANTCIGILAGVNLTAGNDNIFIGRSAGFNYPRPITIAPNVFVPPPAFPNNVIAIGSLGDSTNNDSNRTYIANIRGVTTGDADAVPVVIDRDGQLGTVSSSRKFKTDIKPMDQTSDAILALKPVTFHYKNKDTEAARNEPQFGLIAEEVAEVAPDLVVRDKDGQIYSVRYDAVNALLLNEFIKEHKKVEDLKSTVALQQKGMEVLTAQLKEQASQIQNVNARLELKKTAPRTVATK